MSTTKRIPIYYVEDDDFIAQTVKEFLHGQGFMVSVFPTIAEAKQALTQMLPALVLVDWNMPDGNGRLFCQWIRANWKELPVIFLTVRGDSRDIVSGFAQGADDYVVKPFELEVLFSRITALLRRAGNTAKQPLFCGAISLNEERMQVLCAEEEIHVSPLEYQLLLCLLQNKGKTVTREMLLEHIWDVHGNYVNDNTLTVAIKRLREKLHQPSCLKTIRSVGYRMEEQENEDREK